MENKVVLITGASGGIGREVARMFCEKGSSVILSGTKTSVLKKLANDLDGDVKIIDSSLKDITNFEKKLNGLNLNVDILINNAGITKDGLLIRMNDEDIDSVLNINLSSMIKLSRIVLKNMMKKRFGRIISISSVVGFSGNAGQTNYSASKAGVVGMSKSLALEFARKNINVNCISPGFIETPMTAKLDQKVRDMLISKIPSSKLGLPKDVAYAAAFLSSDLSNYITGETLHVNGGLYLGWQNCFLI